MSVFPLVFLQIFVFDCIFSPSSRRSVDLELSKRLASIDAGQAGSEVLLRGSLRYRDAWKLWHVRDFVLTLDRLAYFKGSEKDESEGHMQLNGCSVDVRESKKEAQCFKLTHPSKKAHKGARMNYDHIILAADKAADMMLWIAAIETAINYASAKPATKAVDSLAVPTPSKDAQHAVVDDSESEDPAAKSEDSPPAGSSGKKRSSKSKAAAAAAAADDDDASQSVALDVSTASSKTRKSKSKKTADDNDGESGEAPTAAAAAVAAVAAAASAPAAGGSGDDKPTNYEAHEGAAPGGGAGGAVEDLGAENKSIFLTLLKQVRPGMDLSKVVLPTFILEPRSMLEKLTDFMSHSDILMRAPALGDPLERMLAVVKFYVSGFYIKPAGVKKPYNPIIGETFRCAWHYDDGSKTFFVAEQVSHHPPISAFYAQNRQAGVVIDGSILFGSKFMGTSAASTLSGYATIHFPKHGEEYRFSFPDAHAKGFIMGPLLMELVGVMTISCEQTGYKCELDFKSKPFWGGEYNCVAGKVKRGDDLLFTIDGKWDQSLTITDCNTKQTQVLFAPENHTRLKKWKPLVAELTDKESDRLWAKVGDAIRSGDQKAATDEKYVLEKAQRELHKELKEQNREWVPAWFAKDATERWTYKWFTTKLLDPATEVGEFEANGRIYPLLKTAIAISKDDDDGESGSDRARRRKVRAASRMIDAPVVVAPANPVAAAVSAAASPCISVSTAVASSSSSSSASLSSSAAAPPSSPAPTPLVRTMAASPMSVGSSAAEAEVRQLKQRIEKLETLLNRLQSQVQHNVSVAPQSVFDNKTVVFALMVLAMYVASTFNLLGVLFN